MSSSHDNRSNLSGNKTNQISKKKTLKHKIINFLKLLLEINFTGEIIHWDTEQFSQFNYPIKKKENVSKEKEKLKQMIQFVTFDE